MTDPISRLRQIADASGDSLGLVTVEAGDLRALVAEHRCTGERHPDPIGTAQDHEFSRNVVRRLRKMEAERAPSSELPKVYETGGVKPENAPMIGTAQERELLTRLRKYGHIEAADALQSRIAEGEALREAFDRLVGYLEQKRVHLVIDGRFADKAPVLGDARDALSLQRRV